MILTTGYNYVKLNESQEFYTFMTALWQQAGSQEEFTYQSGEPYGVSQMGYPISAFHFQHLPKGTGFINTTAAQVNVKMSEPNEPFMMVGSGPGRNMDGSMEEGVNEGFFRAGHSYVINIPSNIGPGGVATEGVMPENPMRGNMYDEYFRNDIAAANFYFPQPNGEQIVESNIRQKLDNAGKYRCYIPFLIEDINLQKSVCHKVFPDLVSKHNIPNTPDFGKVHHETYFMVYGGYPKPLSEATELFDLTTDHSEGSQISGHYKIVDETFTTPPDGEQSGILRRHYNINADIYPAGVSNPYPAASADYTFSGGTAGDVNNWDGQVGPGIINVTWLGHPAQACDTQIGNNRVFVDGTNNPQENFIANKEFIGPELSYNGQGQGSDFYDAGLPGPHIDDVGINEFFRSENNAQLSKAKSYFDTHFPKARYHTKEFVQKQIDNGYQAGPFGDGNQFTVRRFNATAGNNAPIADVPLNWRYTSTVVQQGENPQFPPEIYLQPGNIYRFDIRFPIGVGTVEFGTNWARLCYSDDPLGDTGFDLATGTGQPQGYKRKDLEFLPFVNNATENGTGYPVEIDEQPTNTSFNLTSWKTNPQSSVQFFGDYSDFEPVYFEDYNFTRYNLDFSIDQLRLDTEFTPYGIINVQDAAAWVQVHRPDISNDIVLMVSKMKAMPPPKNPVYFEDFDQAGILPVQSEEFPGKLNLNEYGFAADGILNAVDISFWANLGRQDVVDQIVEFIDSGNFPPKRADIGTDSFPGSGNFGGGIFNTIETMDSDYTTQLIQSGEMETPDYVFEQLPSLPLQPWGLVYFEDFKAFSQGAMQFIGNLQIGNTVGNAIRNYPENNYLTANLNDPFTVPMSSIWDMNGNHAYKGGIEDSDPYTDTDNLGDSQWYGSLDTLELGQSYDVTVDSNTPVVFRNPFLENESEFGPHTVVLSPGTYTTITFVADENIEDITFSEDDIGAWEQIQMETGEYTGHVQDWIRRYISLREGGYGTGVSTYNQTYLPRSNTGHAVNGPLSPNYTVPPAMNEYPLLPNGMAYIEDFGSTSIPLAQRISEFIAMGFPLYADWYATFSSDPNFFSHIPPNSPLNDDLPVFGPKAIKANLMKHLNFLTNPIMAGALNGDKFIKPGPNAGWRPVPGQELILPYSSGSYDIEYVIDTTQVGGDVQFQPPNSSFVLFGSNGDYPNQTPNSSEVAVYYTGNQLPYNDPNRVVSGWYAPRTSPIFDNGLQTNKAYFIQHQLPHSVYFVTEQLDMERMLAEVDGTDIGRPYNMGIAPPGAGSNISEMPYVELPPRVATKIFFRPQPGPHWYPPGVGSGVINEWLYDGDGLPILREHANRFVPYLGDNQLSVQQVVNHVGFQHGRIYGFIEEREIDEQGLYLQDDTQRYFIAPDQSSVDYLANNRTGADWFGTLTEFLPGRKYNIILFDEFDQGTIWPFFGSLGTNASDMDNNYFPTMPVGIDEPKDFDIDGDMIVSIDDWNIWQNPPSGPARIDIADYIQDFLTTKPWLIYYREVPIETDPAFEQVNIEDINISLIASDGQRKVSINESNVTVPYFGGDSNGFGINGNQIHTASMEESNKDYFIKVLNNHTTMSNAEHIFDVSFGHIKGSGSYIGVSGIGSSEAVYKQHLSNLVNVENIEVNKTAGSNLDLIRGFHISTGSQGDPDEIDGNIPGSTADDSIYILSFNRNRFGDSLKVGDWQITLSGSLANGNGHTLKLTDDSKDNPSTPTLGGPRYNIISGGIDGKATNQSFGNLGWFYPTQGTMILSGEKLSEILPGDRTTAATTASVVPFSHLSTVGDGGASMTRKTGSGFFIGQHTQSGSLDHRNSLRLVNMLRNVDGQCMQNITGVEEQTCVTYLCNVKPHQLNFTSNPSFTSYEKVTSIRSASFADGTPGIDYQPFFNIRAADMHGDPQTYINQINLHDDLGNVLATAKLSKPLNKSFTKEAMIKVKLSY